jgi:hypothetical protein
LLKVNIDGAFNQATGMAAWGFVVHDSTGEVVLAGAGKVADISSALRAKTTACWTAIDAAVSVGISKIHLETDSLLLQKVVLLDEMDQAPASVIFQDIRRVIREFFLHFECSYVPRLCNSSTHEIAALGIPGPYLRTKLGGTRSCGACF